MRLITAVTVVGLVLATMTTPAARATEAPVAFTSVALPTWQTNGVAWTSAAAGGLVFVGGTFSSIRPPGAAQGTDETARKNFAVFDAATGDPTSCAPTFDGSSATVRSLDVSPDGQTLYIGGLFTSTSGSTRHNVAALDISSCTPISSFQPTANAPVRALVSTAGTVWLGGDFTTMNGTTRNRAAAVRSSNGTLLAFSASMSAPVRALALKPDDTELVVGGDFTTSNGSPSVSLTVVNATTGRNTHTYRAGFFPTDKSVVKDIAVDDTGFYTGSEGSGTGKFDGRTAVDWSTLNKRWTDSCLGATQAVVVYQGLLYSGSHAHDCSSMGWFADGARNHFLAESVDGPQVSAWFPQTNDGISEGIGPRDLVVATSGTQDYLWSVGEFTSVNGVAQEGMTRFGQGLDAAGPSAPVLTVSSFRSGQAQVAWRPSFDSDDTTLTYTVFRDDLPIATGTSSNPWWSRQELDVDDTGLLPGSTHSYRVSATDGVSTTSSPTTSTTITGTTSTYATQVLADGATTLLRYDEDGDVFDADASDNRHSAVLQGSAIHRVTGALSGDASTAMTLTGATSYLYAASRVAAPTTYTEETWFKTTSTSGGVLLDFGEKQVAPSLHEDKQLFMTTAGKLAFGVVNGTAATTITSPSAYNNGAWHHVAATQGSGGMTLYVDGTKVAHNAKTTSLGTQGFWRVGGDTDAIFSGHPSHLYFLGSLDETAFYPTALSAATLALHAHQATITPPGGGSVSLTPTADTYANAGATTTTYGSSSSLTSRGSPMQIIYLRFALPAAPAGTTLTAATLSFRTTTDTTSGSAEAHPVALSSDAWNESTLDWVNHPAVSSTVLGTITGTSASNTAYSAALTPSGLTSLLGTQASVAITGTGPDGLTLWATNYATTASRPHLVLTFS